MTDPFEATPEMVKAALDLVWEESETHGDLVCRLWRAMAAVAPDQSAADQAVKLLARKDYLLSVSDTVAQQLQSQIVTLTLQKEDLEAKLAEAGKALEAIEDRATRCFSLSTHSTTALAYLTDIQDEARAALLRAKEEGHG